MTRRILFMTLALGSCVCLPAQQPAKSLAPTTQAAAPQPGHPNTPDTLFDGTPVKLRLSQTISSADAKVGQEVPFEVIEDVQVDGVTVLPKGSTAIGTVTEAQPKKRMGRGGKLNVTITYARLADNEKVALRAVKDTSGGGHVGAMTGAMVATGIVFFPAAPLFLFMHGKDITIPQGTEITAFVEGDMHLDMSRFRRPPTTEAVSAAGAASKATLAIDSAPPGADISVDGAFVGDTPSTVDVAPGTHEIAITKQGFSGWNRKINVTGGNIHISADLQAASSPAPKQ